MVFVVKILGSLSYRDPPYKPTYNICSVYWKESRYIYKVHFNVTEVSTNISSDDVTLYTHLQLDRLYMLQGVIERWPGITNQRIFRLRQTLYAITYTTCICFANVYVRVHVHVHVVVLWIVRRSDEHCNLQRETKWSMPPWDTSWKIPKK